MKSFIIAAVTVLTITNFAAAQPVQGPKTQMQLSAFLLASLPTIDENPEATVLKMAQEKFVLTLLPTIDQNTETPAAPVIEMAAVEAKNSKFVKVEDKANVETKKTAER